MVEQSISSGRADSRAITPSAPPITAETTASFGSMVMTTSAPRAASAALNVVESGVPIDLIFTDVVMPGMDGPAWVRTALHTREGTRVIFMSGYMEATLSDGNAAIPNALFLPKPFSLSDLTALVSRQLEMGPVPAGGQSES